MFKQLIHGLLDVTMGLGMLLEQRRLLEGTAFGYMIAHVNARPSLGIDDSCVFELTVHLTNGVAVKSSDHGKLSGAR